MIEAEPTKRLHEGEEDGPKTVYVNLFSSPQLAELLDLLITAEESRRRPATHQVTLMIERADPGARTLNRDNPEFWQQVTFKVNESGIAAMTNLIENHCTQTVQRVTSSKTAPHGPQPNDRWGISRIAALPSA